MYRKSFWVVKIVGAAMMLLLVMCALTDTWYILPYYLFMFPCAAEGYREFCLRLGRFLQKNRKDL